VIADTIEASESFMTWVMNVKNQQHLPAQSGPGNSQ
jgi:hypothetical protein